MEQLTASSEDIVLVLAPAGFGKTTFVGQWAEAAGRPVAWTTAGVTDHDPLVLMSSILAALQRADVGITMPDGVLTGDEPAFSRRVLPSFQHAIEGIQRPVTLVVDEIHAMAGTLATVVLVATVDALPTGSQIALVGRSRPDLPVDLWRGRGRLSWVRPDELAFSQQEVREYLRWALSRAPTNDESAGVCEITSGWPVGVYLEAMSLARHGELAGAVSHEVHHYLDAEVLSQMPADVGEFLRRTAILGTLSSGLCDYVLETSTSASLLHRAEQATLLVSELEGQGGWYRTHPLLRERLFETLLIGEPRLTAHMHSRAARWYAEGGYEDEAMAHAVNGDDHELLGALMWEYGARALMLGRSTTAQRWLSQVPADVSSHSPGVALTAAWTATETADGPDVERWAEATQVGLGEDWLTHLDRSTVEPGLALLVALDGRMPASDARDLAGAAAASLPVENWVRSLAFMVHGWLQVLCGSFEEGMANLEHSRAVADAMGIGTTSVEAPAVMGYLHATRDDLEAAARLAEEAKKVWIEQDMQDSAPATALVYGIHGYIQVTRGRAEAARVDLARTQPLTADLARAMPSVAVMVDAFSARSWAMLGDGQAARRALDRADETRRLGPESAWLDEVLETAHREVTARSPLGALTPAELRVWHQLATTTQTIREISQTLYLSVDTVKSHLSSIYRKLGVSSRREALALIEEPTHRLES